jgi:hypothetical protein
MVPAIIDINNINIDIVLDDYIPAVVGDAGEQIIEPLSSDERERGQQSE